MNARLLSLWLILTLALAPNAARAGGFEVPDQSAVAGGTGGAGTARRGDPSSAWYNPAELADGRGFRGAAGLLLAIPTIYAEGLEDPFETSSSTFGVSPPPHLHISYSENEWAIGAYAGISHGTTVQWPDGWWGQFESQQTGILGFRFAPFVSLRLGGPHGLFRDLPDLRFSIGAHLDVFRLESQRALDFIDQTGRVHLLLAGAGVGGDASLYWQATEALAFGFTYKSRTWMRLAGDADFTVPEPFVGRAPDQHAQSEFVVPDRFAIGAAWQEELFGIYADVGISLWSVRDRLVVDFERDTTSDLDTPQNWRDTATFRLGGEVSPIPEFTARAGVFYDMEGAPADTLSPSSPDMARVGVTLGAGVNITPELGVDAYYSYVGFIGRDSTGPDAALARYWGDLHLVGLTLRLVVVNDVPEPAHETLDEPRPASTEEPSEAAQLGEPTPATEAQPDAP